MQCLIPRPTSFSLQQQSQRTTVQQHAISSKRPSLDFRINLFPSAFYGWSSEPIIVTLKRINRVLNFIIVCGPSPMDGFSGAFPCDVVVYTECMCTWVHVYLAQVIRGVFFTAQYTRTNARKHISSISLTSLLRHCAQFLSRWRNRITVLYASPIVHTRPPGTYIVI